MTLGQEQPPLSIEPELREYLTRRFIDVASRFQGAPKFPERKQMPYKPEFGDMHYFGDPTTHDYDAAIIEQGWWGWCENLPATNPKTGRWAKMKTTEGTIAIENAVLRKNTPNSFTNGAVINNYDFSKSIDPYALITTSLANGTITIGVAGWYQIDLFIEATGSNNQDYYGVIGENATQAIDVTIGIDQWRNTAPSMAWSGVFHALLSVGDVIDLKAYCEAGTLGIIAVSLAVTMTSYD